MDFVDKLFQTRPCLVLSALPLQRERERERERERDLFHGRKVFMALPKPPNGQRL